MPRLAVINAAGANTFFQLYDRFGLRWNGGLPDGNLIEGYYRGLDAEKIRAATIASAIEINHPVNLPKALRALDRCGGVVREVTDQEILDAKAKVGAGGLGCEPASAASVAGRENLCGGSHRQGRAGCVYSNRPPVEGSHGDGGVSQHRSKDIRRSAGPSRRAAGDLRQPGGAGAQRLG